ncbi:MAG: hypothetical protein GEU26_12135 [Nitrososphaeraceae archaeon]|nr:hypothetical protein [Nitrososphaeraceae archaeon]
MTYFFEPPRTLDLELICSFCTFRLRSNSICVAAVEGGFLNPDIWLRELLSFFEYHFELVLLAFVADRVKI